MVFCQRFVKLASKPVLAGGLSFSAGIMLYVSFIEILGLCQKRLIWVLLDLWRQRESVSFLNASPAMIQDLSKGQDRV